MTTPNFPELRAAGERAAEAGLEEAIESDDVAAVVRRYLMLAAVHGHQSPAVAAFILALAHRAITE